MADSLHSRLATDENLLTDMFFDVSPFETHPINLPAGCVMGAVAMPIALVDQDQIPWRDLDDLASGLEIARATQDVNQVIFVQLSSVLPFESMGSRMSGRRVVRVRGDMLMPHGGQLGAPIAVGSGAQIGKEISLSRHKHFVQLLDPFVHIQKEPHGEKCCAWIGSRRHSTLRT